MNAISLGAGNIIIPFNELPVQLGGKFYRNLIVIARLLNVDEINRIMRMKLDDPYRIDELYEDICKSCIIAIPGLTERGVDLDYSSAGLIPTVGNTILVRSLKYSADPIIEYENATSSIDLLEQMSAIVSRYLNTPYFEVKQLPINKLFEMYAVCAKTFPNEVMEIKPEENNINQGVGVNDD